jgi:hypothetical protein
MSFPNLRGIKEIDNTEVINNWIPCTELLGQLINAGKIVKSSISKQAMIQSGI